MHFCYLGQLHSCAGRSPPLPSNPLTGCNGSFPRDKEKTCTRHGRAGGMRKAAFVDYRLCPNRQSQPRPRRLQGTADIL
jgi:hypothetical protein